MANIGFVVGNSDGMGADLGDLLVPREFFTEGSFFSCGYNGFGNLGINDTVHRSTPTQVFGGGTNWKQVGGSFYGPGVIKTDGTLWTWGNNIEGQLGINDTTRRSTPVQVFGNATNWKKVAGGSTHMIAIKTDGTLWTWGSNSYGQLGINAVGHRSTPVQVFGNATNWKQFAGGSNHTAAIKTDGTLWVWGANGSGELGTNDLIHRSTPIQTILGGADWKQVGMQINCSGTVAIKTNGTLWTWGYNYYAQLGTNDTISRSTPTQVTGGGTNWKQVSGGQYNTAAIKTDGTLWIWGYNSVGNLGINDVAHRSTPVQTAVGGTNWKGVACSSQITAIKTDGTLWGWGQNNSGALGINDFSNRSTPVQTAIGGTNWKQVSVGGQSAFMIKDDIS